MEFVKNSFFTVLTINILCNVTMHVKNTVAHPIVMRVEDMSMVKNDVLNAKYSSSGMVCGVLVADVY